MYPITRRECLAALPLLVSTGLAAAEPKPIPLGFSLYGMKSLPLTDALKACRTIGYAGVEFALMPGYPAQPKQLSANDRKELRARLTDLGLAVHGLMENLPALGSEDIHKSNLERLKAAAELGLAIAPGGPLETILGGKPAEWDKVKDTLAERLGSWAEVGRDAKTVIAVKPHVGNALHTVEGAKWLVEQVNSPWLQLAFDYSHFALRGVKLETAIAELAPRAAFAHVKEAKGTAEKFEFLLPGQGMTDYAAYVKLLTAAKYRGPVVVEVSSQISAKKGYDPVAAAKSSFATLAPAFGLEVKK
jgi:sugar phosphate isomerase/epimerase